jgi:hypothetical protein
VFQARFIKGTQTTGNGFVSKTTDKYFRFKRVCLYSCFADSKIGFDSILREALWYKLRKKEISDNMVKCIKEIYDQI